MMTFLKSDLFLRFLGGFAIGALQEIGGFGAFVWLMSAAK